MHAKRSLPGKALKSSLKPSTYHEVFNPGEEDLSEFLNFQNSPNSPSSSTFFYSYLVHLQPTENRYQN